MNRMVLIVAMVSALVLLNSCRPSFLFAQDPSGAEILEKVDQNISSKTRIFQSKMVIHGTQRDYSIALLDEFLILSPFCQVRLAPEPLNPCQPTVITDTVAVWLFAGCSRGMNEHPGASSASKALGRSAFQLYSEKPPLAHSERLLFSTKSDFNEGVRYSIPGAGHRSL